MTSISIIGIGNMGSAITGIAAKSGASVQVVGRDQEKVDALAAGTGATAALFGAPLTGDIVVLAVPFGAVEEILATYGEQLGGKIVVDITNPVDFSTFDGLVVPADGSAADVIAAAVPTAKVVKAFNTTFAATLASGSVGTGTTTVLVAGDDQDAKDAVIAFVTAGGVNAEDAGSLKRARELESLGFLQISRAARDVIGWTGGFAVAK
ncbi:NADPH-dependent F420 reductase [Salinibacterium soli]|uniref:NADPH-dependent F420 reductase n=1 Tax=Antiquaquibacter soli TaxID=3064523 RepID=A0ABT9BRL9_9MICO|nr:NADPH-dependent F420 reductase [Protaetiibacter sp. WY-16]MDO7883088.1 NADPH-dependent F420 reductase [Protaetiibacter sp. WY-16]